MPSRAEEGRNDRLGHVGKSSWQTLRLHVSLGPEVEPPSAPADLPIP